MTEKKASQVERYVGLLLMVIGVILFPVLAPIAAREGTTISGWTLVLIFTWVMAGCVAFGTFLLVGFGLRRGARSFLIAVALTSSLFGTFLLPLPSDIQLLLAASVAFVAVLLYRYHAIRSPSFEAPEFQKKTTRPQKYRTTYKQKAAGIILILVGLFLYISVFSAAIEFGLFIAMAVSLLPFFIVLFGCSQILGGGFKRAILWWVLFTAVTMLPWITLLPLSYQIISYVLLATAFILLLLWARRKWAWTE